MTPDRGVPLHRRVRWGNVARLAAALAALALVLAWPRLKSPAPPLPPGAPTPAPVRVAPPVAAPPQRVIARRRAHRRIDRPRHVRRRRGRSRPAPGRAPRP